MDFMDGDRVMKLHETTRFRYSDKYVIVGSNPDNTGGGVIGTADSITDAHLLQVNAIKANYSQVRVMTWDEFGE